MKPSGSSPYAGFRALLLPICFLERDGETPEKVYRDFLEYVEQRPIVSYNLDYDLDTVLKPEWKRLGIVQIGMEGFCALKLAQRLLDPVPAGNCKLQTLRQFYRLPERGAHTALGDVETVIDLLRNVIQPLATSNQLNTWSDIINFTNREWYPSRIAFGKFKSRDFHDALKDSELRGWLEWLSKSSNPRSSAMGKWYLENLGSAKIGCASVIGLDSPDSNDHSTTKTVVIFSDIELERLREHIKIARQRLAELEAQYTKERNLVDATRSSLFLLLKEKYQKRDQIRLIIQHRQQYIQKLLEEGEQEAAGSAKNYQTEREQTETDYENATKESTRKKLLNNAEQEELKSLWKKLVMIYHPDRFNGNELQKQTYEKLTKTINQAREDGNIELLREISSDPTGFVLKQGWEKIEFSERKEFIDLQKIYTSLQGQIIEALDMLNNLRESDDFRLYNIAFENSAQLNELARIQNDLLDIEISKLETEANKLKKEIAELTGSNIDPITGT